MVSLVVLLIKFVKKYIMNIERIEKAKCHNNRTIVIILIVRKIQMK